MGRYLRCFLIITLICLSIFAFIKPVAAGNNDIVLEFFISSGHCDSCEEKKPIVKEIENFYGDNITVERYPVDKTDNIENYNKFIGYGFKTYPAVVVKNTSAGKLNKFSYSEITFNNLKNAIDYHLAGNYSVTPPEPDLGKVCIPTPFGPICINISDVSLPILTILIGAIDSINPCSFFVLLFLLSLLLYTKSRKRMLLVGGIFIFFSGFIYFLLMAALLNFLSVIENLQIIAIVAGVIAVSFGALNIKDFFFFKKGPSTGIPDSQKSKLYKQMRKIIRISSVPSLIFSTIVLAISANTVELLCSFNLPLIYTGTILPQYNLGIMERYLYLIFYNVVYIIPLLIIVGIMVATLGRWKLSDFQGRVLKLFSGIMIFSLGLILLINYELLQDVFAVIYLLLISIFISIIISIIWKKKFEIKENSN